MSTEKWATANKGGGGPICLLVVNLYYKLIQMLVVLYNLGSITLIKGGKL